MFLNQSVYVIGGGNSLRGFDYSFLKNKTTIAINSAYKFVPNPSIIYFMDQSWALKHEQELLNHPAPKYTSYPTIVPEPSVCGSKPLLHTGNFGYDNDPWCVRGNNSGVQAINFVANHGAKEIILLGFDFGKVDGRSHFHDEYIQDSDHVYQMYKDSFDSMIPFIQIPVCHCTQIAGTRHYTPTQKVNFLPK